MKTIIAAMLALSSLLLASNSAPEKEKVLPSYVVQQQARESATQYMMASGARLQQYLVKEGHADGPDFYRRDNKYRKESTEMAKMLKNFKREHLLSSQDDECVESEISRSNDYVDPLGVLESALKSCGL